MSNSLGPETNTRDTQKCSACRHRKKKCIPHDRDWENSRQKCAFCETHGLPCGPNVKYGEDPAVIRRRVVVSENASAVGSNQTRERHPEGSTVVSAPTIPAPAARRERRRNEALPDAGRVENETEHFGTTFIGDVEEKAFSKLHEFHALGNTLSYVSQPAFVYCPAHGARQPYHDLSIEEKLHDLFINIYAIAVEANARNESHMVRWILLELVYALDQYPQLLDSRKKHILLKIARVFQGLGHHWIYEHTLLKIAGMHKYSALPSQEDPYHLLANSFRASSMSIRPVLVDRWNETVGGNCVDSNLIVPSLLAAVQHRSPYIILALLVNPQVRANIDERDLNGWTALYTAVANGDEPCCMALLLNGADANTRDYHGHTVLEVAVKGGYLNIVETLIKYKANVNPDLTSCSSPPLHAAIESGQFHHKIVDHLLQSGARVDLRRLYDSKHAIDIAADLGYHELAERMILSLNHTFPVRGSFMSQILP